MTSQSFLQTGERFLDFLKEHYSHALFLQMMKRFSNLFLGQHEPEIFKQTERPTNQILLSLPTLHWKLFR